MSSLIVLMSSLAHAWDVKTNTNGDELKWNETNIHYSINTDGHHGLNAADVESAIVQASNAWKQGQLEFIHDGETKKTEADYSDNVQSVVFKNNWTEDPDVLALTYTWATADGQIVHFDMEINTDDHDWSTTGELNKQDLTNAIAHEFGHALGLDHSTDLEATMAPNAAPGETIKRDLAQDDINGFNHLYENIGNNSGNSSNNGNETNNNEGEGEGEGNGSSGGGGTANPYNSNKPQQTGGGMVPLENSSCASASGSPLWMGAILGLMLGLRRRRDI